jgi:hypothetical protein
LAGAPRPHSRNGESIGVDPLIRKVLLAIAMVALCVPLVAVPFGGIDRTAQAQNTRRVLHMSSRAQATDRTTVTKNPKFLSHLPDLITISSVS